MAGESDDADEAARWTRPTRPRPARLKSDEADEPAASGGAEVAPIWTWTTSTAWSGAATDRATSARSTWTSTDERPRIDLGSMILTGFPGAELRLQVAERHQQIVSAMLVSSQRRLRPGAGAYAAPRSGGLWAELRDEISRRHRPRAAPPSLAEGPFGVELRRLMPVTTPDGEQGYQPSRMWVAEGPRWLLRGIVYGQAALSRTTSSRRSWPRCSTRSARSSSAAATRRWRPGDLLPLTMPTDRHPTTEDAEAVTGARIDLRAAGQLPQ